MVVYTRIHLVIVSIHTPTQGVTTSIMYPAQASQFQSTHPRRVWLFIIKTGIEYEKFQSTHPRRVWPRRTACCFWKKCFNPHTHAGCDVCEWRCFVYACVSIHTPTQGVTFLSGTERYSSGFQSTHPRRVWLRLILVRLQLLSFNPHTHAGCDYGWCLGVVC